MTGYLPRIMTAAGCDEKTARVVEEVMRVEAPTLDALTPMAFDGLARRAHRDLAFFREDHEFGWVAEFYEKQAGVA